MGLDRALLRIEATLGSGRVITDREVLDTYAQDESEAPPQRPGAVVRVRRTEDVSAVLSAAHGEGIPVTARGGGTGRVGGAVPSAGGLVVAFEQMNGRIDVARSDGYAIVDPGVVTGALHRAAEEEDLFYPPDPNSWETCTVGGNVATNAGGPRAYKYGVTREYVLGLEVVLADGTIVETGRRTRKGVSGYDLTALMVGSEGTLGLVTRATLRLVPLPERVATLLVFLPTEVAIGRAVTALVQGRISARCVELLDESTLAIASRAAGLAVPRGAVAMLIVELDGADGELDHQVESAGNTLDHVGALSIVVAQTQAERERIWSSRREMSRALRRVKGSKMSEDVVVPPSQLAELLAQTRRISEETGITMPSYGHAGDGNLHVNFLWGSPDEWPAVERGIESLMRQVIHLGGTLSGEHGIGLMKAPYLHLEHSAQSIALQKNLRRVFDPKGILNPGKVFRTNGHGSC